MRNKKVFVTGSKGFIGAHLARFFHDNGYDVYGCSRNGQGNEPWTTMALDLLYDEDVVSALREIQPSLVLHCAGVADVGRSVRQPELDFCNNVGATHNLLFGLHKLQLTDTRVVFLSSAGVYGNPQTLPITENAALNPLSPYALHKVMCEEICNYFAHNYQMDIKIARIFSAYGEGLRKQIFWDMYRKIQQTGQLDMFGTGDESRDYIYIDDLVQAIYLIATTDSKYTVYNVANGVETTIRQAAETFADVCGLSRDKVHFLGTEKEGNPRNWRADISRIQSLGYRSRTEFVKGVQNYRKWVETCQGYLYLRDG